MFFIIYERPGLQIKYPLNFFQPMHDMRLLLSVQFYFNIFFLAWWFVDELPHEQVWFHRRSLLEMGFKMLSTYRMLEKAKRESWESKTNIQVHNLEHDFVTKLAILIVVVQRALRTHHSTGMGVQS